MDKFFKLLGKISFMIIDYDSQAEKWCRDEPNHYSDFCGRPEILEIAVNFGKGKIILDLGCGEGYFARQIAGIASKVIGVDISEKMVGLAREKEKHERKGIEYYVSDAGHMSFLEDSSVDVCIGNYITNYFSPDKLSDLYGEISRVLKKRGSFALLMPHPVLELITDYGEAVQYDGKKDYEYPASRGEFFSCNVRSVHGEIMKVGLFHSTFSDHIDSAKGSGLEVVNIIEPVFPEEIAEKYPVFENIAGKVACMIIYGENS